MVPDKFNMVDMGGIDLIESQGVVVDGLYQRLVESIAQCRYQCLYNWKFDGILIPPTYVEMVATDEEVSINGSVTVDVDDIIHIYSINIPPVIESLNITENGEYEAPDGVDGYNPVAVSIPPQVPVLSSLSVTENGTYEPPEGVDGYNVVTVDVSEEPTGTPFIESQGTAYFDTGVAGNSIYKIELDFMPVSILADYQWYAGAASNNFTLASMRTTAGAGSGFIRAGNVDFGVVTFNLGQVNKLVCDNGVVTINNTQLANSYTGPINTTNTALKLLGGSTNSHSRMFSCKLYDQNGSLIRNYIPFLDSDYVACLKDLVTDTLLYPTTRKLTFGYAINGGF